MPVPNVDINAHHRNQLACGTVDHGRVHADPDATGALLRAYCLGATSIKYLRQTGGGLAIDLPRPGRLSGVEIVRTHLEEYLAIGMASQQIDPLPSRVDLGDSQELSLESLVLRLGGCGEIKIDGLKAVHGNGVGDEESFIEQIVAEELVLAADRPADGQRSQ